MIEDAFKPLDPRKAQYYMPVAQYVDSCAPLKPGFIHHPETKKILQGVVEEYHCDLEKTCIDVDRSRMPESAVKTYDDVEAPEEAKVLKPELASS